MDIDLGASSIFAHRFTLYLPGRNFLGENISNIEEWVKEAAYILTSITGGVTRLAPAECMWSNKEEGILIIEITHILYTYFEPVTFTRDKHLIHEFICRFGRETSQQSVAMELDAKMLFVTDFTSPEERSQFALVR